MTSAVISVLCFQDIDVPTFGFYSRPVSNENVRHRHSVQEEAPMRGRKGFRAHEAMRVEF